MHRNGLFFCTIVLAGFLISCSTPSKTTKKEPVTEQVSSSKYPSWYSDSVESNSSELIAYGVAINSNSDGAISSATAKAKANLKSAVSDKLEHLRSQSVTEYGSKYNLDSSRFLIALRKADKAVTYLASSKNKESKPVEGQESYYGFAEVAVSKSDLVERIGKRLSGYEKAWNAMKDSEAFEDF